MASIKVCRISNKDKICFNEKSSAKSQDLDNTGYGCRNASDLADYDSVKDLLKNCLRLTSTPDSSRDSVGSCGPRNLLPTASSPSSPPPPPSCAFDEPCTHTAPGGGGGGGGERLHFQFTDFKKHCERAESDRKYKVETEPQRVPANGAEVSLMLMPRSHVFEGSLDVFVRVHSGSVQQAWLSGGGGERRQVVARTLRPKSRPTGAPGWCSRKDARAELDHDGTLSLWLEDCS